MTWNALEIQKRFCDFFRVFRLRRLFEQEIAPKSLPIPEVRFGWPFKTHNYFIACCTLIPQVAVPMLSRVT